MKSMTGYGKGEASNEHRKVTIELKAVNNRYLEIIFCILSALLQTWTINEYIFRPQAEAKFRFRTDEIGRAHV